MQPRYGAGTPLGTALAAVVLTLLTACTPTIPTDPEGTLDDVRGGVLRVGVSPSEPWTEVDPDGTVGGTEVELITGFAESLDADVVFTAGGEEELVAELEHGELEVVIGGLTSTTPWTSKAAVTTSYVEVPGRRGKPEHHVMLTPMGENAFLVALERYLLAQDVQP